MFTGSDVVRVLTEYLAEHPDAGSQPFRVVVWGPGGARSKNWEFPVVGMGCDGGRGLRITCRREEMVKK